MADPAQHTEAQPTSSLASLPSRSNKLFSTAYFNRSKPPVTYIALHDRTSAPPEQHVSTRDSPDDFQRMVKRATGQPSSSAPANKGTKRGAESQSAGPSKKASSSGTAGPSRQPPAAAPAGAPSTSAPSTSTAGPSARAGAGPSTSSRPGPSTSQPPAQPPTAGGAPPAAAALAAAVSGQQQQGSGGPGGGARRTFSQDELKAKSLRDLKELCKSRGLQVSGNKDQLLMRIVEHQRKHKGGS